MKTKTIIATLLALVMVMAVSPMIAMAGTMDEGTNYEDEFTCGWLDLAPTVDGDIDINEYANATVVEIDYEVDDWVNFQNESIYLYFGNDAEFFYLAIDLCPYNYTEDLTGFEMAFDEDNDDEFEPDYEDGNEQFVYGFSEGGGIFGGGSGEPQSKDVGGEGTFGAVQPISPFEFDEDSFNASIFSNKPILWAIGFDETVNSEDDHYIWELQIPLQNWEEQMGTDDAFRFMVWGGLDYGDEDYWYPIELDPDDPDFYEDSSDWAEVTLASQPAVAPEGLTANDYAMIMIGIGFVFILVMTLFFREWVLEQIEKGKDKMIWGLYGVATLLLALGLLQWYYDWVGYLI